LKNFFVRKEASLDDNKIFHNLRNNKVNSRFARMNDYSLNFLQTTNQILDFKLDKQTDKNKINFIKSSINNPSLGKDYVRKKFGNYFKNKNLPIHENKFKKNYKQINFDSLLMATRVTKDENYKKYENSHLTKNSRQKLKWKTINWVIQNKKEVVERLREFFENDLKNDLRSAQKSLSLDEFCNLMKINGITNDLDIINKLFWVFDEDGDKTLKFKEIAFGIEMFSNSTIDKKLKAFFDMCDTDYSGSISKNEFLNLMKKNIINNEDKAGLKQIVEKIFSSVELDNNGEIVL
jgi:Ca2+-binding EF-hand superfamily protein